ncbi:MAG TPA: cadmium-translocating P-type ATPase, partial [Clostridiaceae bacterium]|nr:cadmium-translocating P-type ATPase [Clostridiaceae bacterium]
MTVKRDYEVTGVDCVNCAAKIESGIKNIDGVISASLNYSMSKLSIEVDGEKSLYEIERKIQKLMDSIEKGSRLKVTETGEKDNDDSDRLSNTRLSIYIIAAVSYFAGMFFIENPAIELVLFIFAYMVFGYNVLLKSAKNILRGRVFDENFLMSIATIGALIIGEYPEAAAVMMFYQVGELFQDYAVNHSRRAIKSLIAIKPDYANLKTGEGYKRVAPSEINIGDYIVVRPGERVPLDGVVTEGVSAVDTSALTGESLPRDVGIGSEILSGSINMSGVLTIRVTRMFENSTVSRILEMVESASQKKANAERFITRFAAIYTPLVAGIAVLLALIPPLFFGGEFNQWIYRALLFLVVSCPCALVISIPLGFFGGIGAASRRGILVKGGNYLEALAKVKTVVFDKTGTLTSGSFEVTKLGTAADITEDELLYYAAHAEAFSTHPLAASVIRKFGREPDKSIVTEYAEYAGMGVSAKVSGRTVLLGNKNLFDRSGIETVDKERAGT